MTRFSPVSLPPEKALNGQINQTMLRRFDLCPRSAYLHRLYDGGAETPAMHRGSAFHRVAERAIRLAIEQGEAVIPGDLVKVLLDEVLCETHVPIAEQDFLREMCWRFAAETAVDPSATVAVETLFVLGIAGWKVRCRVDFAELVDGGAAVHVADWKTSRAAPTWEDISRVRPDGTRMGKAAQIVIYALALAFGVPVREEIGPDGEIVEMPEPFPVAGRAQRFDVELVFPGIEDREGKMLRRGVSLTRLELEEFKTSLAALLERVAQAERTGDWPAVVSDAACGECPAASLCPIPRELRDHRGEINTVEEFAEAMAVLDRESAEHRARRAECRNFVKARGGAVPFDGKVAAIEYSESEQITDKEGLLAAVDRAVSYGEPFDRADFVKVRGRNEFKTRDVTADELTEVAGGD